MAQSDAQTIATASNCLACIPSGLQPSVQTMLLATLAGGSIDPQTLLRDSECLACLDGMQSAVQLYLLARIAGASTDPNTLAALATCFRCLDGNASPAITFLICEWLNGGTAGPIPGDPSNARMTFSDPTHQNVHWQNAVPLPLTNEVYRSTNGGAYALLATVSGNFFNNLYTDSTFSVNPADTVCYKVRSCNGTACSGYSNITCEQNQVQTVP